MVDELAAIIRQRLRVSAGGGDPASHQLVPSDLQKLRGALERGEVEGVEQEEEEEMEGEEDILRGRAPPRHRRRRILPGDLPRGHRDRDERSTERGRGRGQSALPDDSSSPSPPSSPPLPPRSRNMAPKPLAAAEKLVRQAQKKEKADAAAVLACGPADPHLVHLVAQHRASQAALREIRALLVSLPAHWEE